jgi:sigma-E factor negative regulatory protein RseB
MTYAVAAALLAAASQGASAADDPREWLERMNRALETRNYDGTFFHLSDGRVETMRVVHRVRPGSIMERLLSLDGSGREFVRNNDELTCYLPDQHTVLVEPRRDRGPFLGSLPQFGAGVNEFYRFETLPPARVLGRPARVIAVNPTDQFRFGYRLWLDEQTAMPLKTQLCDSRGRVIEQILFARLEMLENIPDAELTPTVHTDGMRWVRQGPAQDTAPATLSAFRASQLPPGFHLTVAGAQTLGGASVPTAHLVYSDGVATVSVFVEEGRDEKPGDVEKSAPAAADTPPMQGLMRVGSGFAFSTVVQGHQVTAVGEVPAQTVEFIAHSVKSSAAGGELPRH